MAVAAVESREQMEMEKEEEKEQLVRMGFPDDLASQALAATGGNSILKATDWIFTRQKPHSQTPHEENPNSSPSPSQH